MILDASGIESKAKVDASMIKSSIARTYTLDSTTNDVIKSILDKFKAFILGYAMKQILKSL